ncbi:hypothetical protein [Rubripirellula lacrimiformis]|uniref:hypothetical protein n=1 Tax=Rubripirellula lacrimiformis TaxID=1930273 RepID=UPI00119FD7BE|nr:hypothetical protein [Rubripirellula lacrimiformis]
MLMIFDVGQFIASSAAVDAKIIVEYQASGTVIARTPSISRLALYSESFARRAQRTKATEFEQMQHPATSAANNGW